MKGATIMIIFWGSLLLMILLLFIKSWIFRTQYATTDDPKKLKKKFRGITSNPAFCQAIYISFKNQQASASSVLTAGDDQTEKFVAFQECSTCTQIEEGSTMPYSDNRCPQCGKDVSHLL